MPNRNKYYHALHKAIVQDDGLVSFDWLLCYGGAKLHFQGSAYNAAANVCTLALRANTYDDHLQHGVLTLVHVPTYRKDGRVVRPERSVHQFSCTHEHAPSTDAPVRIVFHRVPHTVDGKVRYRVVGMADPIGPPVTFRPSNAEEAARVYPYHV
jgi:hypothetical protein